MRVKQHGVLAKFCTVIVFELHQSLPFTDFKAKRTTGLSKLIDIGRMLADNL